MDVIRALEEKHLSLTHVSTWDFSTLYTSLPHAQLKNQFHDLLERVFHTKGKSFIATNSFRTFWTTDRMSVRYTYFSCRELCLAIDFLATTSTFALETLFSGRLLVYPWAPIVHLCWLISSFIPSSTISWSNQWNRTLPKPSSSATPFGTSIIYSALTILVLFRDSLLLRPENGPEPRREKRESCITCRRMLGTSQSYCIRYQGG